MAVDIYDKLCSTQSLAA